MFKDVLLSPSLLFEVAFHGLCNVVCDCLVEFVKRYSRTGSNR